MFYSPFTASNYSNCRGVAASSRALVSSGVVSPGCGSYNLHFVKARCETSHWLLSKPGVSMMQAYEWGRVEGGPVSRRELSGAVTGQDPELWPGEAWACQLSPLWHWLRPSIWSGEAHRGWREEPVGAPGLHAQEGRNAHSLQWTQFTSTF